MFLIQNQNTKPFELSVKGRVRWALEALIQGPLSPLGNPAPRISSYVHSLGSMGVTIDTEYEFHGGEFAGTHGKCKLVSTVSIIKKEIR